MSTGCLSDIGYASGEAVRSGAAATAALIGEVAAGAIALADAIQLVQNYKDQRDIANREIAITREQQGQVVSVFWPREDQFLAEFSVPEPLETVDVLGARYAGRLVAIVAGAFASQLHDARSAFKRYTTSGNEKQIQDLMLARSNMIANARVFGRSIGWAEYQARDDVNVARRMQAVELGRGLMNEAMGLFKTAAAGLSAAGSVISSNLGGALSNFSSANQQRSNARIARSFFSTLESDAHQADANASSGSVTVGPWSDAGGGGGGGATMMGNQTVYNNMRTPINPSTGDKSGISNPPPAQAMFAPQNAEHHTSAGIGVGPAFANAGDLFIPPSGMLAGVGLGATKVFGVINLAGAYPFGGGPDSPE